MNFIPPEREENSAYLQLLMLTFYAIVGLIIGSVLSFLALVAINGTAGLSNYFAMAEGNEMYVIILKVSQVLTTGCLFILPPIWLARKEKKKIATFYGFKKPTASLLFLVFIMMVCAMPVMEWVGLANQKMVLPDFLRPIQEWMREKEDAAMKMTVLLLKMRNGFDFFINILVIALLPAIAEELFFRGGIQRSFNKMFNNQHIAIWLSAFIFSAIHVQFFGFFPRLLLGAGFGYIYLWTGSLWYAMFAHFLNNGYAVGMAWYLEAHNQPLSAADNTSSFSWYGYVISLILTIYLFKYLKTKNTRHNGKQLG